MPCAHHLHSVSMDNFIKWLEAIGRPNAAKLLGITPAAISHWLAGRRSIRPEMAKRIEKVSMGRVKAIDLVFGKKAA